MMDHEQAVRIHAAERYLLRELSPEDHEDFEEHYVCCTECADEVRLAFALADNLKALSADEAKAKAFRAETAGPALAAPRPSLWRAWLQPATGMPVAAALVFAFGGFVGLGLYQIYQSAVVIPQLKREIASANQALVIPSAVARAATRGEDAFVETSEHDRFIQLTLDVNLSNPGSLYASEVYDEAGTLKFSVPAAAPSGGSLHLLLPVSGLKPGRYVIRVRPVNGAAGSVSETHTDEYGFQLRSK